MSYLPPPNNPHKRLKTTITRIHRDISDCAPNVRLFYSFVLCSWYRYCICEWLGIEPFKKVDLCWAK